MGGQGCTAPKFMTNGIANQVTVTLPRPFDNFDEAGDPRGHGTVGIGNVVQFWVYDSNVLANGRLVYQGSIDAYTPQIDTAGTENISVTLTPFDTILGDVAFIGTQNFGVAGAAGTYVDPATMFLWPFQNVNPVTGQPYTYPLTQGSIATTTGTAYQNQWHNQNTSSFFESCRILAPINYYWRVNPDKTIDFTRASATARHTFIVGKHLTAPQYAKDAQTLKNYVWVKGSGVQATAQGADIGQYGQRTLTIVEQRLYDQQSCNRYAAAALAQNDVVTYRCTISVSDIRGDGTGLGYDIELIRVGDTCRIVNPFYNQPFTLWDSAIWDSATWDYSASGVLNQVVVISGLTYKFDSVDLELSLLQPSQDRFLVDLANQFATYTTN